jgi:Kdo2-lipid IVA lauroyltransferase/acyltransferase
MSMASMPADTLPRTTRSSSTRRSERPPPAVHAPPWQTHLWQRLVVTAMVHTAKCLQGISPATSCRFGNALGNLAYYVAKRQRRRALANLHLAYGEELTSAQRAVLTRRIFQHFGRAIVDFLRAPARNIIDLSQAVSSEGWEHIATALNRGKGVVLVTGHLGNWELLGRWLATVQKVPLTVVAREPDSPALAAYLRSMRENAGFTVLSKGESARGLLRALRRGEAILILNDQNSGDLFTPFFGIPAGTAAGPASLAQHSGASLIPLYCMERPDHSFLVKCLPPIDVAPMATETAASGETRCEKQAEVVRITTRLNEILEGMVRQHPEQWLWLHNRWKSAFDETQRHHRWSDETAFYSARERWKA